MKNPKKWQLKIVQNENFGQKIPEPKPLGTLEKKIMQTQVDEGTILYSKDHLPSMEVVQFFKDNDWEKWDAHAHAPGSKNGLKTL